MPRDVSASCHSFVSGDRGGPRTTGPATRAARVLRAGARRRPQRRRALQAPRPAAAAARTDVAFFLNSALLTLLVGAYSLADSFWHGWWDTAYILLLLVLLPLTYVLAYRAAIDAGKRWGFAVRASFDLHRFELYERMGLRRPVDPADEHQVAEGLNLDPPFGSVAARPG